MNARLLMAVAALAAGPARAQGFISPGVRTLPEAPSRRAAPPVPQPPPSRALPTLQVPDAPAAAGPTDAAPAQRAALPAPRTLPPPSTLPPAEAARRLRAAIEGGWARSPELTGAPGRQAAALARAGAADSLTPGPPSLGGGFVTDGVNNRRGGREGELSLATPLWLPGEGTASRRAADADFSRLTAQQRSQRLAVAGEVREALAGVALAQLERDGAEARLRDARALEADVARRVRGREAAEAELLSARLDRMDAEIGAGERRAALDGADLAFRSLTGMAPEAGALNEPDPPLSPALLPHPQLAEADRAVAAADAARRLAAIQVRDSPEIGVLGRTSREAGNSFYDHRIGLQFRLPFATGARNAPRQAAAEAEVTDAVAARENLRRQLDLQAARARIQLEAVRQALLTTRQRAVILRQQRSLAEAAFRGGQVALGDILRVRALATEAEVSQGRAEIAVRQARSRLNQSLGILP